MTRILSLAHLSILDAVPPDVVSAAAAAGFDAVNLRLVPARDGEAQHPMIGDTPMRRETLARLRDTGVTVNDVEVVWLRPDTRADAYAGMFETAARLGARRVIAAGGDPDEARTTATFAAICDAARPHGLSIDLEFMRWAQVKSLAAALRIVTAAGCGNAGILVDCLHAARAGTAIGEIAALPPSRIGFVQLCDAPVEPPADLVFEARSDRLPPGEGGLPLDAMLRGFAADVPISVEVPMTGPLGALPPAERAALLHAAARKVLDVSPRPRGTL